MRPAGLTEHAVAVEGAISERIHAARQSAKYRPDIDGLRAVAIAAVFVFHAKHALLPGGFVGVDVFFVISGFLIIRIILDGLETDTFSLAGFYARRIRRILPRAYLCSGRHLGPRLVFDAAQRFSGTRQADFGRRSL
jgi:peptidoglycan/LPS O-acetylase OafA/YrhL